MADGVQAQQLRLLPVQGLQLGYLRPASARQCRCVRVVLGFRLPWPRAQRIAAAEPGHHLQKVGHPEPGEFQLLLAQILDGLGLTTPVSTGRCCS